MLLDPNQARALLRRAVEEKFALLAVNADSHAAVTDCLEAARECAAPIIIETSLWQLTGRSYGSGDPILGLARYLADLTALAASERFRDVPVIFHTDHIKGQDTIRILSVAIRGVPQRASTISLDSSEMSEEENIAHICKLCEIAGDADVPLTLEMEAGVDAGVTEIEVADRLLGAVESRFPGYLALWAPGVGTQHGLSDKGYPFSPEAVARHQRRASEICGRPIGLALHGSSGLAESDLAAGVAAGVAKVNWSSESLLLRSQAAQEYYAVHTAELAKTHPRWKATAMDNGVQTFVSARYLPKVMARIRVLGGEGRAGRDHVGKPAE
ncbi:MAG TPA: class II fructose-bisphosphate aldolase [Chthoniobacteraceae bacterium]|jgi:tagatose 1,6-diphosphate aldolase GatY/KbaY|nr:class II fructose-bisphosphate aldolase [Chthoniobacteraceae bacterium]